MTAPSYAGRSTGFMSTRELIQYRQDGRAAGKMRKLNTELRAEAAANRADGLLQHAGPTPWDPTELRRCEPGCWQHSTVGRVARSAP